MTPPSTRLRDFLDRLPMVFVFLGVLCLAGAAGVLLVLGQLDRVVIVLAAIGVGLLVYAALERPERTAQTLTSRNVRYGSNALVMSVAFIAILGLVNVLANRYTTRLDLTQNQLYTLSPLSVQVTKELKQPVHAIAFFQTGDTGRASLEDVFKEYVRYSSSFTYEFVDPQLQPGLARQYQIQFPGTTVLISGAKQQTFTGSDEGSITTALLKLERDKPEVVYYLTGHGELDFTNSTDNGAASALAALTAQNYDVKSLNLGTTGKVPADAALVIVAGPTAPLLPQEVTALESYLDNGGKAAFFVDKRQRPILEPIAERYGVQIGDGIVVDPAQSLMNDPLTPLITNYQASPVTKDLPEILLQAATTVDPTKNPSTTYTVQPLAQTTAESWLNLDPKVVHFDPATDPKGPLNVAVSVTKNAPASATPTPGGVAPSATGTRIVFIGDVAFATNAMLQFSPGNKSLLTNVADWLTSNEDLIQIQAKSPNDQTLTLSNTQLNVLLYGSAVFVPLIVLAAGTLVWWKRR